jgi:hypothetical protein
VILRLIKPRIVEACSDDVFHRTARRYTWNQFADQ